MLAATDDISFSSIGSMPKIIIPEAVVADDAIPSIIVCAAADRTPAWDWIVRRRVSGAGSD